jgi:predicted deacylase
MNPFGFERNYRYCSNHTDPNRDLNTQTTKEMQILTQATKEKYDLVIDFHEATCDGTFFMLTIKKEKNMQKIF